MWSRTEPPGQYWSTALITGAAMLGCLLAHELAHAVVARRHKLDVTRVTLWMLGGVTEMEGESADSGTELRIAIAGSASREAAAIRLRRAVTGHTASDVMSCDPVTLPSWFALADLSRTLTPRRAHGAYPLVGLDGSPDGVVTMAAIARVPVASRHEVRVRDLCTPIDRVPTVAPVDALSKLLAQIPANWVDGLALVLDDSRLVGVIGGAALAFIVLAAPAAAEPATPAVYPTGSTATWGSGLGFGTCSAPSIAALRAWKASPYRTLNIYFSGVNRACTQPNLTASWVRAAAALGWRLLPTYFGRQPPCAFGTKPYRYAASNAGYYGTVEAKDAAAKAAALGLLRGSALYADVEHLADTTKSPDPSRGGIGALTWAFVRGRYWD